MPLVFLIIFITGSALLTYIHVSSKPAKTLYRKVSGYGSTLPAGSQLVNKDKYILENPSNGITEEQTKIERLYTVETAMIRTCKTIATLALDNRCANPERESNIWSFLGGVGATGDLKDIWDSTSTPVGLPVFSCTNMASFGRQTLVMSLPREAVEDPVTGTHIRYNLQGLSNSDYTDPCGYVDLVSI